MTRALVIGAVAVLSACNSGSSTGGGTAYSPFVGTYQGSSGAAVSGSSGALAAAEPIAVFVHRDGLVQIGSSAATIYTSGPLKGDALRLRVDAAALVDPACSGTVSVAGTFSLTDGGAAFRGEWASDGVSCFGEPTRLSGPITAERVAGEASASRVIETHSPALLGAFRAQAN